MNLRTWCALGCGALAVGHALALRAYAVETLVQYQFPDLPEGIAVDADGTIYTSMALTGEIRKRAPDGMQTPLGAVKPEAFGLALGSGGVTYAAVFSGFQPPSDPDANGVWQLEPDGTASRLAALPLEAYANDIVVRSDGSLLASDSLLGKIYAISPAGVVADWLVDPVLAGDSGTPFPIPIGANGMAMVGDDLYVNNLTRGMILRVPVQADGSAGAPVVAATDPRLFGADGLASDPPGNLYVANIVQNTVLRVTPSGVIDVLADVSDGLDGPTSLDVGPDGALYFVNSGLLTTSLGGNALPSLMRIAIPEPGTLTLVLASWWAAGSRRRWLKPAAMRRG